MCFKVSCVEAAMNQAEDDQLFNCTSTEYFLKASLKIPLVVQEIF